MSSITKPSLDWIRDGRNLSIRDEIYLILKLSFPAIMAQISYTVMQYIDASMVGHLGPNASAAVGLVGSSTWLVGGLLSAFSTGFYVLVAQRIGAKDEEGARNLVRGGLISVFIFSLLVSIATLLICPHLPGLLHGASEIREDAIKYFAVFALTLPIEGLLTVSEGMVQSSGNIRLPSLLNIIGCALDVFFNWLLIPRFGVMGASLGTSISIVLMAAVTVIYLLFISPPLHLVGRREKHMQVAKFIREEIPQSLKISLPIAGDNVTMGFAYIAFTRIVAPIGTIALAANSFAITAESLCYMPGYGVGIAATTIVGQAVGARRESLAKNLGWVSVASGMIIMTLSGAFMYAFAPQMMGIMSADYDVCSLGTTILRIEAFAEPFFGAAIVSAGVFRGAGKTLGSSVINLISVWAVRIPLAIVLSAQFGLAGAWMAMCIELCFRGILFLFRMVFWRTKG